MPVAVATVMSIVELAYAYWVFISSVSPFSFKSAKYEVPLSSLPTPEGAFAPLSGRTYSLLLY